MLPKINNKSLMECKEEDFQMILNDPDYRENQYLEYKQTFAFLEIPKDKKTQRAEKITEFRNDVCAFANAEGGYLIYGISDNDDGIPESIVGVDIAPNVDKFEMDLRNKLNAVLPQIPPIEFYWVRLSSGKYIAVIFVKYDYYAPYIHLEKEKNYKIYKRVGNQKAVIGYTELRNMFIQSRTLEGEIEAFKKKRIEHYATEGGSEFGRFILFHIIPESFLNEQKELFLLEREKRQNFGSVFAGTSIDSLSIPCVDGLRYIYTLENDRTGIIFNNGIAEFALSLTRYIADISNAGPFFYSKEVWDIIGQVAEGYRKLMPEIFGKQRYFGCISIIGCMGIISESQSTFPTRYTKIDRHRLICPPVCFTDIGTDAFYVDWKKLHLEYMLSLGIKYGDVDKLVNDIKEAEQKDTV